MVGAVAAVVAVGLAWELLRDPARPVAALSVGGYLAVRHAELNGVRTSLDVTASRGPAACGADRSSQARGFLCARLDEGPGFGQIFAMPTHDDVVGSGTSGSKTASRVPVQNPVDAAVKLPSGFR